MFPRATILYLARTGAPSELYLMQEMAMVGKAGPVTWQRALYSSSLMSCHVPRHSSLWYSER
eukprot:9988778-Ditylum_brightwellii.AAC.1